MIFLFEAVPESIIRRYFLQVKKLTFKRAPGSHIPFYSTEGRTRVAESTKETVLNLVLILKNPVHECVCVTHTCVCTHTHTAVLSTLEI
jgi:hypothetical protein